MTQKQIKHIGYNAAQENKTVVVVYRNSGKGTNSPLDCLVVYPENLHPEYKDYFMKAVLSDEGQASNDLSQVFHKVILPNGRDLLNTIHARRDIKVAQQNVIIMCWDGLDSQGKASMHSDRKTRLYELNQAVDAYEAQQTQKHRTLLPIEQGFVPPPPTLVAELAPSQPEAPTAQEQDDLVFDGGLSNEALAKQLLAQSDVMAAEAKRLRDEAITLDKSLAPKVATPAPETKPVVKTAPKAKAETKKPGRPKKVG
jgi:hypothetical protein